MRTKMKIKQLTEKIEHLERKLDVEILKREIEKLLQHKYFNNKVLNELHNLDFNYLFFKNGITDYYRFNMKFDALNNIDVLCFEALKIVYDELQYLVTRDKEIKKYMENDLSNETKSKKSNN